MSEKWQKKPVNTLQYTCTNSNNNVVKAFKLRAKISHTKGQKTKYNSNSVTRNLCDRISSEEKNV